MSGVDRSRAGIARDNNPDRDLRRLLAMQSAAVDAVTTETTDTSAATQATLTTLTEITSTNTEDTADMLRKFRLLLRKWIDLGLPPPEGLEDEFEAALAQE